MISYNFAANLGRKDKDLNSQDTNFHATDASKIDFPGA